MSGKNSTVRGVAYYRHATPIQEAAVARQTEWARRAAWANGVELLAEFADVATAGGFRPGLAATLAWCAAHATHAVVCEDFTRLGRTAGVTAALVRAGVTRVLTREGWLDLVPDPKVAPARK
jgi:DNA invertase Pin-like site-specific DNA recombinase